MSDKSIHIAKSIGDIGAGTIEYIFDQVNNKYYFMFRINHLFFEERHLLTQAQYALPRLRQVQLI